jgi:hypothetical protein
MSTNPAVYVLAAGWVIIAAAATGLAQTDAPLPAGVKAVWDIDKAFREKTPTRERVCLNGLWRWQPADKTADAVPAGNWGFVKVPGTWPGSRGDYQWRDSQTYYAHPSWAKTDLGKVFTGWYQREFTVPKDWAGRRLAVTMDYLNTAAAVYVDGKKLGEAFFPGGEVDITSACKPGEKQVLSIFAAAVPLGEETTYFAAAGAAFKSKSVVNLRALCGDVFLVSTPAAARIADVKVETSVRKWEIAFNTAIQGAAPDVTYVLRAVVTDKGQAVKEFKSQPVKGAELVKGRFTFANPWKPDKLWDTNTPGNMYQVEVSLLDEAGGVLDTCQPIRFGFREFWVDGRDFRLNGTRIYCFVIPIDSAQIGPSAASYDGARETLQRLKAAGVNLVYTHNYGCEPGTHLSFAEILRAADDVGMLVSFSQPHASSYNWKAPDADETNGYARHAEFFVRAAQNHPAVVMYSMNHNMCGYFDEHNPDHIDGLRDLTGKVATPSDANAKLALRTEAIVQRFDATRPIYHHSSGNLGQMFTLNIYLNHVPAQERCDWFAHWATEGVKPLVLCEYGTPSDIDWSSFRGWYKGTRYFWNGQITWEMLFPEWGAQYRGDKAFDVTDKEKADLRFEAKQWRSGKAWFRWDYPFPVADLRLDIPNILDVLAMYIPDNWRAYRAWGVTVFNTWEWGRMWTPKPGVAPKKQTFPVDWENLQRPGYSPDVLERPCELYEYGYAATDWAPTVAAKALLANNLPLLAYIADKPAHFTSKDHNFLPGQTVEKQVIVINNSRLTATCDCQWSLALPQPITGGKKVTLPTGEQERIGLKFDLPPALPPGAYELTLTMKPDAGEPQKDTFVIHVLTPPSSPKSAAKIALFDPKGQTEQLLKGMGVAFQKVEAGADLAGFDIIIIGKAALTVDGAAPGLARVKDGLKVVVFEQTADALEKRLGFRVEEYGLRWVFKRLADHPILAGLSEDNLRDWRGEATIMPGRLQYDFDKYNSPKIQWCGLPVLHPWRCGNWGNVASVLIEKPTRGDFLPIVDGGFSLQYSPLMECRQGKGLIVFCQLDVTGRTEADPAAEAVARNIIGYVAAWKSGPSRTALYVGDPAGKAHLEKAGVTVSAYDGGTLSADQVLIVGPGGGAKLAASAADVSAWLQAGGNLLAIGLDEKDANAFLPFTLATKKAEYISTVFEPFATASLLAGIGPADVHNRDPRALPLVTGGAKAIGSGVLAQAEKAHVVFCQLVPWEFDYAKQYNLKRTYRRAAFTVGRILAGMGVSGSTPLLERFAAPVAPAKPEKRWLDGLYLDQPEELDDPYRFFCW